MKKLISLFLLLLFLPVFFFAAYAYTHSSTENCVSKEHKSITYLFVGFDDASSNTDSIILGNYSFDKNEITFVQIPRDTYCSAAPSGRINSIYPAARAAGKSPNEAMSQLVDVLKKNLGINIDCYVGYTTAVFVNFIDAVGGVPLRLPYKMDIKNSKGDVIISLNEGDNLLSGVQALDFVRSRNSYQTADIGRINAQKLFISSFVRLLKQDVGIPDIIKVCIQTADGWVFDAKFGDLFQIIKKNRGRISNIGTQYANIPGESVKSNNGNWYYSLCIDAVGDLFETVNFDSLGKIDPNNIFLKAGDSAMQSVYYSSDIKSKVFNDNDLFDIPIR